MQNQVKSLIIVLIADAILMQSSVGGEPKAFVHPGLLQSQADLDRMKAMVTLGSEPWKSGFARLRDHPQSRSDWRFRGPFRTVIRGPRESRNISEMDQDANAAFQNAILWYITGRETHARKSVEILNAWSATLREITGRDRILGASLAGFKFVNAAEIIRSTYPGWQPDDRQRCQRMFRNVFYPVIQDFATFANGNWDTGCIKTIMGIGVFCDDRTIFDHGVDYFRQGAGNGRLTHYIVNDQGQCQESGRDQQHTQLGLSHLAEACEIAWNQGLDLYSAADNRLLKGFEYTALYNLGQDVPFVPSADTTEKYKATKISPIGRGSLRPIYEMVWNHYENRNGIKAPYTRQAAESIRPEGGAQDADHPGFGTLLFTRQLGDSPPQKSHLRSTASPAEG
jgi:Alginate lyase